MLRVCVGNAALRVARCGGSKGLYNPERPESSHPNQKGLLRSAAIRLLCTTLAPGQNDQDDEELAQYKQVCKGIRQQNDGHFLSMVSSLVLAIITGRTDLCVSGVFGAGKTRAAAALIAGLMIVEPALNLMVMTKENTRWRAQGRTDFGSTQEFGMG